MHLRERARIHSLRHPHSRFKGSSSAPHDTRARVSTQPQLSVQEIALRRAGSLTCRAVTHLAHPVADRAAGQGSWRRGMVAGAAPGHDPAAHQVQDLASPGGAHRAAERHVWDRSELRPEALRLPDELHHGRAAECIDQLCRTLPALSGRRPQSLPVRKLRARGSHRGDPGP